MREYESSSNNYTPSRPYRLELKTPASADYIETINFGPRRFGDAGRDILVARHALGSMELIDIDPANPDIFDNKNHWLDCMTGKEISLREAATFDSTMETYLTKFQLDNQFYILSYLFSKYGAPNLVLKKDLFDRNNDEDTSDEKARAIESEINQIIETQMEFMDSLFSSEFGSLGEATLAVLHGWLPRTRVGLTSYYHDPNSFEDEHSAHDIVLRGLHQAFMEGVLSQRIEEASEIQDYLTLKSKPLNPQYSYSSVANGFGDYLGPNGSYFKNSLRKYKNTASPAEQIQLLIPEHVYVVGEEGLTAIDTHRHFAVLRYNLKAAAENSILYSSFLEVSNNFPRSESVSTLSSKDYADAVTRIGEPDPLTDPDPFEISNTVMGFFYKTDYTLENLPPLKPTPGADISEKITYQNKIMEVEQQALYSLLKNLNKPVLFKLDPTLASFQDAFTAVGSEYDTIFDSDNVRIPNRPNILPDRARLSELHPDLTASTNTWVLAPQPIIDEIRSSESSDLDPEIIDPIQPYTDLEYYPDPENTGLLQKINTLEPLIKFVEFRFPSLRPGDQYRAKFLINRKKIDQITDGLTESQLRTIGRTVGQEERFAPLDAAPGPTVSCEEAPLSPAQQERRYEEYKALAAKRKREIARALRESQVETTRKETEVVSTTVDLGVFGNAAFNLGPINMGGFSGSPEEFSNSVLKAGASLLANPADSFSDWAYNKKFGVQKSVSIKMTYREIKDRVDVIAKDLREAYTACLEDKVKLNSNYNGNLEATELENALVQLKSYIQKGLPKNSNFQFENDSLAGLVAETPILSTPTGALDQALPNQWQSGVRQDYINIIFTDAGALTKLTAGQHNIDINKLKTDAPAFARPMTSNYFSQLYRMSGGFNMGSWWFNPFDLGNSELCSDLDLGKKGLAYLKRYTRGLDGIAKTYEPLQTWYEGSIESPFVEWWSSGQEARSFDTKTIFGADDALNMLGKGCTIPKIMHELVDRVSLGALLCDFLKCLKIPAFNLQHPNFSYPDWPDFSVFRWWAAAWKFLWDNLGKLVGRFLCTFARTIIDFLRVPWCEEILRDQLFGEASSSTSVVQNAMAAGLLDLGLDQKNADLAPNFIERAGIVLTNRELCRLLQGDPMDPASIAMLTSVARSMGLDQLDNEESIRRLYDHIGMFMPEGFCEALSGTDWLTTATTCEDTATAIADLRMRLLANDASEEEIERVLSEAEGQLMSQARAFEILSEQGLNAVIPPIMDMSNPDAIINDLPKNLMDQTSRSIKDFFEMAKMSYVSSLSAYGSAYYLNGFKLLAPGDDDYDEEANIIVETILENFRLLQSHMDSEGSNTSIVALQRQIHFLYQIYETTTSSGASTLKLFKYDSQSIDLPTNDRPQEQLWSPNDTSVNWREASHSDRAQSGTKKDDRLYPRPVGFSRNKFFSKDEDNKIITEYYTNESGERDPDLQKENSKPQNFSFFEPILLEPTGVPFHFINNYKLLELAMANGDIEQGSAISYLQQILSSRMQELQGILSTYLPGITTPQSDETHLGVIKDAMRASKETNREIQDASAANHLDATQAIYYRQQGHGASAQELKIDFQDSFGAEGPSISLYEFKSVGPEVDGRDQRTYDPYTVVLEGSNLFSGDAKTFRFCDAIVGPDNHSSQNVRVSVETAADGSEITYIQPEDGAPTPTATQVFQSDEPIPGGIYTRREIFARRHLDSIRSMAEKYDESWDGQEWHARPEFERLNHDGALRDELYENHYPEFLEGIFEQVFFSLRNSRIYDEDNYFDSLRRRVSGQVFYNEIEGCYKNRYNVSQLGVLSFDKIVTDEIASQIKAEMSRPENSFQNIDYDDIGPIEKAIQNVCLIGFIRICLVELLLKGSLAYSVWDFEGVYDEPLMKDFVYEFVKDELERTPSISQIWPEIIVRITGIEAKFAALRRLVHQQAIKMQDLSKNVYQNNPNIDYYRWFTKYFIPQSEVSRQMVKSPAADVFQGGIFVDADGNIIQNPEEGLREFQRPDHFYWAHPLRDQRNIILNPEIESNSSGLGSKETAKNHVNGNDPFFHIEHGLRVTGPLAALETMILPTREIIAAFTDANYEENPELFTTVDRRLPEILNIEDSLSRVVNLPAVNIEDYRFKETPEITGGAAGSSVEVYDAEGSLAEKEEIYHIDDFLGALNNALNEDDLDKYIKHMQGLYDYDAAPEQAPGGIARNTDTSSADGYPYAIDRTPTRFIKKTRRVIKFKEDFVSHGFGDFFEGLISEWGINKFHNWLKDSSMGPINLGDNVTLAGLQADCRRRMAPSSLEEHSYYIIAEDAKQLMKLSNLVDLEYNTQPGPGTIDEKSFDMVSLMRGSDEEQAALLDHVSKTLKHSLSSGPSSAFYNRVKIDSNQNFAPAEPEGNGIIEAMEQQRAYYAEDGTLLRTFGAPHLITLPKSADDIGVSAGIQRTLQGPPESSEFNAAQDRLVYQSQRIPGDRLEETAFENKLGEFRTEDDFARARALHSPNASGDPYWSPDAPQLSISPSRDEYWVETVYDFSGDASILAGLYGSFTIGDTFDPAVLHFAPEKATSTALDEFHEDVIEALYPEGELNYGVSHIKNNDDDGMLTVDLSANSRTFFVKAREDRVAGRGLGGSIRFADAPLGPYLIRPMGIDKFSNVAMTAPYLLKNPAGNHGNNNDFRRTSPFSTDQGKAHVYGFLRHAQSQSWQQQGAPEIGENSAGYFGVANVDSENPRNESCRILHTDNPEVIQSNNGIKLEAKKNKLLPPNVYPIPLRVLVTRVYVGGMSNPSEVYCRVVMPEYLENLKKSTAISEDSVARLSYIQANINKLNAAIRDILAGFTNFHNQISGGEEKDLTSLDDKIIPNNAQPEWRAKFPDFTQDYNNRDGFNSSKLYRSSAINPTSRVQYCSIERVYSKAFENDVARDGRNEKDELDKLFSNRGNLLRPPNRSSSLAPHNFYSLEKDYNVYGAGPEDFHMNMRSLQSILDIFLKEKRPDSLWGALSAENVSPLSTEGFGPSLSLGIENPSTNILPRNIEDRTLKFHSGQDLTTLKNLHNHLPDLSFTQTAPLGLTLSARVVGEHMRVGIEAPGQHSDHLFARGILPSWSQALLPTVVTSTLSTAHIIESAALINQFGTWKSLSPRFEMSSGFHQPYAIARNHNFFAFSSEVGHMQLNPEGALQWDSDAATRKDLADDLDEIDYYFKGEALTLIPRYGHGEYSVNDHRGNHVVGRGGGGNIDRIREDYNEKSPAQSGMLTDGPGDYLVNYNRVPAIKMPSHQKTSYYADGRLSLADVSIYIRSVVKNALMRTSRQGLGGDGLDNSLLDSIYNYGAFFRNTNNVEIMRLIIQQGQASEGEVTLEDSFQVASDEDSATNNIYAGDYSRRRRHSMPITSAIANEAYELIKEFLEGISVMVSRRYMYSVRTECDIEFGETDFTNPTAPFILNFLIKVYAKIHASTDLSPEEKIAAFAAMSQYDLSQKVIASHVKPDSDQRFQLTEFENPDQDDDASTAAKTDWAQACLYYMHIMLCWLNTSDTFHKADLDENFANLFYAICINVGYMDSDEEHAASEMFRLRMYPFPGYNSGHDMGGNHHDRVRFADGSISANYSWGQNRIIGRLGSRHDESHIVRTFTIRPRTMSEFLPGGTLEAQISGEEGGIGGIENFIRLVHRFHEAACEGLFGVAPMFMKTQYGASPAGILQFLEDTDTDPRGFNWPDFTTEDSQFFDDANPDPANWWARAWEKYINSLGGSAAQIRITAVNEAVIDAHERAVDVYSEQERTTVQNGQIEDILLKLDYDMYKYVFYDRPAGQKIFIKYLKEKGIISEDEPHSAVHAPQQKGNYDRAVLNVLYTSQLGTPRMAANTIYNIKDTIQTADNMRHHYMSALNRVTGVDQALSAAVFDNALVGLKEGLLRGSSIDQVCRFVSNIPCHGAEDSGHGLTARPDVALDPSFHVNRIARSSIMKKPSEEMRTGFMPTSGSEITSSSAGFLSTPLAEFESPISPMGEVLINCWPLSSFKEKYHLRQNSFAEILLRDNKVKPILEYIFPVKRFQAISTIYTTATLAGYSTMPSILQAPKHNLAFLTKMSSLNSKERNEFLKNHSQAESMKALMDNPVSDPKNIDCFDSMLAEDWWEQFKDMLADLIKYFPSALFRGIASTIDPAYKEMKAHWEQCEIEDLTFRGTRNISADRSSMSAGLQKPSSDAQGKYSMVMPSAIRDLIYSTDSLLSFTPDTKPMKRTLERMTGYLYKGPIALMDGIFAFEVPCLDHSTKWPGESPKAWNADRYGHPMSPFTALALMTHQLPGEKKMRQRNNACADDAPNLYSISDLNDRACFTPEPSPFGQMPKSEDFE